MTEQCLPMNLLNALFALIILTLGVYFWWRFFLRAIVYRIKNYKNGHSTMAEIIALQDTLLKIQYRPMYIITLRFKDAHNNIQQRQLKVLISKHQQANFTLGQSIHIRYDPNHLDNIQIRGVILV